MFDVAKYILFGFKMNEKVLIFDASQVHAEVAKSIDHRYPIISAGFITFIPELTNERNTIRIECFGNSVSLRKDSRKEDSSIVSKLLKV